MKTIRLDPNDARHQVSLVADAIEEMLSDGKRVAVTVSEEHEQLSPQQAARLLGFSRQHVVRLINSGQLVAEKLPSSSYWRIPVASVIAFEERRGRARRSADEFSRLLDELGAPLE
jgi:excisionase family DNA binding protein